MDLGLWSSTNSSPACTGFNLSTVPLFMYKGFTKWWPTFQLTANLKPNLCLTPKDKVRVLLILMYIVHQVLYLIYGSRVISERFHRKAVVIKTQSKEAVSKLTKAKETRKVTQKEVGVCDLKDCKYMYVSVLHVHTCIHICTYVPTPTRSTYNVHCCVCFKTPLCIFLILTLNLNLSSNPSP